MNKMIDLFIVGSISVGFGIIAFAMFIAGLLNDEQELDDAGYLSSDVKVIERDLNNEQIMSCSCSDWCHDCNMALERQTEMTGVK